MTPGRYKGNDEIGRLIHDFKCLNSGEVYNSALAAGIKQYKETEGGRKEMSDIVERYGNKMEIRWKSAEKSAEKSVEKLFLGSLYLPCRVMGEMKISQGRHQTADTERSFTRN